MKLSARNVIPGKVVAIDKGETTAHVRIEIAGGQVVTAAITDDPVQALGLEVGKAAYAVVKASNVIVATN